MGLVFQNGSAAESRGGGVFYFVCVLYTCTKYPVYGMHLREVSVRHGIGGEKDTVRTKWLRHSLEIVLFVQLGAPWG